MFTAAAGDRQGVPDVAIVVWDGIPASDWQQAIDYAIQARQRGIRVIGVAVGTDVQPFGLSTVASWPSTETVFTVPSSSQLPTLRDRIVDATCNGELTITGTKVTWQRAESLRRVHPTPRLHSPGGSIGLIVWLQFAIACFGLGFDPQNLLFP